MQNQHNSNKPLKVSLRPMLGLNSVEDDWSSFSAGDRREFIISDDDSLEAAKTQIRRLGNLKNRALFFFKDVDSNFVLKNYTFIRSLAIVKLLVKDQVNYTTGPWAFDNKLDELLLVGDTALSQVFIRITTSRLKLAQCGYNAKGVSRLIKESNKFYMKLIRLFTGNNLRRLKISGFGLSHNNVKKLLVSLPNIEYISYNASDFTSLESLAFLFHKAFKLELENAVTPYLSVSAIDDSTDEEDETYEPEKDLILERRIMRMGRFFAKYVLDDLEEEEEEEFRELEEKDFEEEEEEKNEDEDEREEGGKETNRLIRHDSKSGEEEYYYDDSEENPSCSESLSELASSSTSSPRSEFLVSPNSIPTSPDISKIFITPICRSSLSEHIMATKGIKNVIFTQSRKLNDAYTTKGFFPHVYNTDVPVDLVGALPGQSNIVVSKNLDISAVRINFRLAMILICSYFKSVRDGPANDPRSLRLSIALSENSSILRRFPGCLNEMLDLISREESHLSYTSDLDGDMAESQYMEVVDRCSAIASGELGPQDKHCPELPNTLIVECRKHRLYEMVLLSDDIINVIVPRQFKLTTAIATDNMAGAVELCKNLDGGFPAVEHYKGKQLLMRVINIDPASSVPKSLYILHSVSKNLLTLKTLKKIALKTTWDCFVVNETDSGDIIRPPFRELCCNIVLRSPNAKVVLMDISANLTRQCLAAWRRTLSSDIWILFGFNSTLKKDDQGTVSVFGTRRGMFKVILANDKQMQAMVDKNSKSINILLNTSLMSTPQKERITFLRSKITSGAVHIFTL